MDETVQVLAAKLDAIRSSVDELKTRAREDRELAREDRETGDRRHEDNVRWLQRIDANQQITNGKVITLEGQMRDVFRRLRERVDHAQRVTGVTLKDVGLWVAIIGGTYVVLTQAMGFHR